jgi:hypothetical protein
MGRWNSRTKASRRRNLLVESLEGRAMLAGNVAVNPSGINLNIRGDNLDNQIGIVQLASGQYAVLGLNGTTVNGSSDPFVRSGITGNIEVDLRGGNDVVGIGNDIDGLVDIASDLGVVVDPDDIGLAEDLLDEAEAPEDFTAPKQLKVKLGDGHDAAGIIANVGLRITAELGSGDNALAIRNSLVGDDVIVRSGAGDDTVEVSETGIAQMLDVNLGNGFNRLLVFGSGAGESAVINTGSGGDLVVFDGCEIDDNMTLRTGNGNDTVVLENFEFEGMSVGENVDIDTGSGNDYFYINSDVGSDLKVKTGGGNDDGFIDASEIGRDLTLDTGDGNDGDYYGLSLFNVDVGRNLKVYLGQGNDSLNAFDVNVGREALVDAGNGRDFVSIEESAVNGLFTALMGSGNDFLRICDSVAAKAKLDGGAGDDDLESDLDPDDLPPGYSVKNFEEFFACEEEEEEEEEEQT